VPAGGDIIGIDTDSAVGHEQHGRRPVLVVSVNVLQTSLGLAMVCAITTNGGRSEGGAQRSGSSNPSGLPVKGVVLPHQLRTIDCKAPPFRKAVHGTSSYITSNAFSPKGPSLSVASHIVTFAPSLRRIIYRPRQSDPWRAASGIIPRARLCVRQSLRTTSISASQASCRASIPRCLVAPIAASEYLDTTGTRAVNELPRMTSGFDSPPSPNSPLYLPAAFRFREAQPTARAPRDRPRTRG